MTIARVRLTPFRLRLGGPLYTGSRRITSRDGVLLELTDRDGSCGLGEAAPIEGFGMESLEAAASRLRQSARDLLDADLARPLDLADRLVPHAAARPAARAALETALLDLTARRAGESVAAGLATRSGRRPQTCVPVSALLPGAPLDALPDAVRRTLEAGFRTLKLKVGGRGLDEDERRVAAVRESAGGAARLRLDVNGAWSESEAEEGLKRLRPYGIELIEQPLPAGDVEGLARLRARREIPIAADEAVATPAGAARVLALGAADVLVLKPAALGGLHAAARVASEAGRCGCDVVVTSLLDGSAGVHAALHLAASLPASPLASGLATHALLREDYAPPPPLLDGAMALPAEPGLGLTPDREALSRLATGPSFEAEA